MRLSLVALLVALSVGLAGCSDPATEYFPVEAGLRWDYHVVTASHGGAARRQHIIMQNVDLIERDGQRYLIKQSAADKELRYRLQEDGIVMLDQDQNGAVTEQLHLGLPPIPGRYWAYTTDLITLNIFGPAYYTTRRMEIRIEMTSRIKSTKASVKTPAGTFKNCLEVQGTGETHVDRGLLLGIDTIRVEETRWYAPGVGLIKHQRSEFTEPKNFNGSLTKTLIRFGSN